MSPGTAASIRCGLEVLVHDSSHKEYDPNKYHLSGQMFPLQLSRLLPRSLRRLQHLRSSKNSNNKSPGALKLLNINRRPDQVNYKDKQVKNL